jgi:hypothetical protein
VPQPGAIKQAAPVPPAIPSSEIIAQAEPTIKRLQEIKQRVEFDSALKSIQTGLSGFADKLNRWWESEGPTVIGSRSVQRLNNILWEWKLQAEQLEDWDKTLAARSRQIGAQAKDVESILETWRATQAAVAKTFLAKMVLQRRVEEVLREAQAARKVIQEQSAKIVELQSQVADRAADRDGLRVAERTDDLELLHPWLRRTTRFSCTLTPGISGGAKRRPLHAVVRPPVARAPDFPTRTPSLRRQEVVAGRAPLPDVVVHT